MTALEKLRRWAANYSRLMWNREKTAFIGFTEWGTKDYCYINKDGHPTIYQA